MGMITKSDIGKVYTTEDKKNAKIKSIQWGGWVVVEIEGKERVFHESKLTSLVPNLLDTLVDAMSDIPNIQMGFPSMNAPMKTTKPTKDDSENLTLVKVELTYKTKKGNTVIKTLEGEEAERWSKYVHEVSVVANEVDKNPPFHEFKWISRNYFSK